MSHNDAERIVAAARRLRLREGAGFTVTQLARPAGMSRATLYRRLAANSELATEVERIRTEGARCPREDLLRSACNLLAERGIAELTMDAVAERAGLSTATLYRHFADRDELVREVLRTLLPADSVRRTLMNEGPLEEVLEQFVEAMLARLQSQPHLLRIMLLGAERDVLELRKFRRNEERLSTALITFMERNRPELWAATPKQLAAVLMGHVLAAFVSQRTHGGTEGLNAKTVVRLFLDGARKRTPREGGIS